MSLRSALVLSLFAAACAEAPSPQAEGALIENHSPTSTRVQGLLRQADGPFIKGTPETLTATYDASHVRKLEWSATAGALSARNAQVKWTLPDADFASLTLTLTLDDGSEVVTPFGFSLIEPKENPHATSVSEALLATPMPVLDGGVSEISGGACEVEYDATNNVHLAFTSATHPAIYYGRWNGSAWALEVMDTLGFNTGGRISPSRAHLRVDSLGNPHILYVRDGQVWYATKAAGTWTRERVDSSTWPAYSPDSRSIAIGLNAAGRPSAIYENYLGSYQRMNFTTRTAPNTWANTQLTFPIGTNYATNTRGDILFDAAGTAYFPLEAYGTGTLNNFQDFIASWNGTTAEVRLITLAGTSAPGWDVVHSSMAWAGTGRIVARTAAGLYDFTIAAPLANATWTFSANEANGAGIGDVAWNGRPVMLHHHSGGTMELVTPAATGASFWTWTQMGTSSGSSGSVTVHPTTGVPSICYQSGGRIMFQ